MSSFNIDAAQKFISNQWNTDIKDSIMDFIRVPNQSPLFDPDVLTNGLQEQALDVMMKWVDAQNITGLTKTISKLEGRTPCALLEIPASDDGKVSGTIVTYQHGDKQPPMLPWAEGLGPYEPVLKEDVDNKGNKCTKLYGRGGADDGYGIYATVTAVKALQSQGLPHARIVMIVEFCEESGSIDLPYHLEALKDKIGTPDLLICLDSSCGDYERLWMTSSLRGMAAGVLSVQITTEGVHSGLGSGVIPSTFRILRQLLDRVEDKLTGKVLVDAMHVDIPQEQLEYADKTVEILGDEIKTSYPFLSNSKPMSDSNLELYLNRSWRPTLSYTGIDGIPSIQQAGNVLRPKTAINLSFRLPPTAEPTPAVEEVKRILEENPPYGATVTFKCDKAAKGFYAPPLQPWLAKSLDDASTALFSKAPAFESGGGSIPFLQQMREAFPTTQFVVTGILGPNSNAHGPNEFLHVEMMLKVTASMAQVINDHYVQNSQ